MMQRIKKIRGQRRIWKNIYRWKEHAKQLDLDALYEQKRAYTKVYVHPFSSIDFLNSITPVPRGKTRKLIISALFEIYKSWKIVLDTTNKLYYLKVWFFPENVSKSQVVCATDERLTCYESSFYKPESNPRAFDLTIFGNSIEDAAPLNWEFAVDELSLHDDSVSDSAEWATLQDFLEARRWFKRKKKSPHRKVQIGDITNYQFPQYSVWLRILIVSMTILSFYQFPQYSVWLGGT